MTWSGAWARQLRVVVAVGSAMGIFPYVDSGWSAGPTDPFMGLREATKRYVAPGTPDELLRLRDTLDRTEREIARLKLDSIPEDREALAEKRKTLKETKDRLAESEALLQILGRSSSEVTNKQLDSSTVKERELLRKSLSSRTDDLKKRVSSIEREIRSDQAEYLRTLEGERRTLVRLLTVRRERLLAEYQALSICTMDDRPCLARRLKILCRMTPLFPAEDRAPLLTLLEDAANQLNVGHGSSPVLCEYLKQDIAL